ncbi:centrosomal protein 43-like [Centruroides vittatus]|uniref:centrosomal protein 43-like n=1 Tax=Centruroides vittatus TaxID=120091 RepID=UPI0035104405
MSTEEDTELRDLVIQTLQNKGVIGKIKAELRASVFLALEEHEGVGGGLSVKNKELQDFLSTDKGWTIASLVREFLQFFHLDFTLAVFDPEISSRKELLPRQQLHEQLNLDKNHIGAIPLLAELIQAELSPPKESLESISKVKQSPPEKETIVEEKKEDEAPESLPEESINEMPPKITDDDNEDYSLKSDDPFYDDILPKERKSNLFDLSKELDLPASKPDLKLQSETSKVDVKDSKPFGETNPKRTFSTLSSLQDLPSLSKKSELHTEEEYEDDFQSSLSGHSGKSGHHPEGEIKIDSSEHSLEEIEEDLSADDILNSSISFGEDATTDQTISQASAAGGYDYIESIT